MRRSHNICPKLGRDVQVSRCIDCHPNVNSQKTYRNCKVRGKVWKEEKNVSIRPSV